LPDGGRAGKASSSTDWEPQLATVERCTTVFTDHFLRSLDAAP